MVNQTPCLSLFVWKVCQVAKTSPARCHWSPQGLAETRQQRAARWETAIKGVYVAINAINSGQL